MHYNTCHWLPCANVIGRNRLKCPHTKGVQKVRRPTQLSTRYSHHILSLFDIFSWNWNAPGAVFLQSSHSVVEELFSWSSSEPFAVQIMFSSSVTLCPFMNSLSLGKNRTHLEPGQHTWSHVSSSTGCHIGFAISVHFFKSGFSDIFHAKSGYPDFIRIFSCAGPYRPLYTV